MRSWRRLQRRLQQGDARSVRRHQKCFNNFWRYWSMPTFLRLAAAASVTLALYACGGGGAGSVFNPNPSPGYTTPPQCNIGASVTTSNPQSGAYGVPTSIGSIEIVTNGNNNAIAANPGAWTLGLSNGYASPAPLSGNLNVTSDPNGYHPFPSDYYFNESVPPLQAGQQYTVWVMPAGYSQNGYGSCATPVGTFGT